MKRTYLSLFMAVVLLVSLVPAGALGAVGCIQCRPGDVIYAVFVLAEDGDRADGVMGRLSYPLEIFSVLPYADLHGLDGFYILNRRPAVIAFQVNQYAPAGEYTIEAIMVEAADADGTKYENVRIEPVRVVVESVFSREEAMAERARLEQKLTEAEAARTELQDKVETLTVEKNETEYRLAEALYSAGDYEGAKTIFDAYPNTDNGWNGSITQGSHVRIEINDDNAKLYVNDELKLTKTYTMPSESILGLAKSGGATTTWKNIKIKPL